MSANSIKAKKNLKKSIYFGGSVAFVTALIGISVAVPTYLKIQNELKKKLTQLSDLSKFMSQLINKLGIEPGVGFAQELSSGYNVEYIDGQTQIYRTINGEKVLVMNMNGDGTVGSAGVLDGLAAQKMLNVIQEAKETLGDDVSAMRDILNPYTEAVEKKSLEIEAAITGSTIEQLQARNLLADPSKDIEDIKKEIKTTLGLSDAEISEALKDAEEQRTNMEHLQQLGLNEEELKKELEKQRLEALKEIQAKEAELKKAYIDFMINDKVINDPYYIEGNRNDLSNKTLKEIRDLFDELQDRIMNKKSEEAASISTNHQIERATSDNDTAIIDKILSNPSSFMNTLAASFGYKNGSNIKNQSPQLRRIFWEKLKKTGVSKSNFERIIRFLGHGILGIPNRELDDWYSFHLLNTIPNVKVTFIEEANTYTEKRQDIARLLVMNGTVERSNGSKYSGFIVGRSSASHILDFDSLFPAFTQWPLDFTPKGFSSFDLSDSKKTIEILLQFLPQNNFEQLKIDSIKKIIDLTNLKKISTIKDSDVIKKINLLAAFSKLFDGAENWKKDSIMKIASKLGDDIINGHNIIFEPESLINALNLAFLLDQKYHPEILTKKPEEIYASENQNYFINKIIQQIFDIRINNKTQDGSLIDRYSKIYNVIKDDTKNTVLLKNIIKDQRSFEQLMLPKNFGLLETINSNNANAMEVLSTLMQDSNKFRDELLKLTHIHNITLNQIIKHIDQLIAIKPEINWNAFMHNNSLFTLNTLLLDKDDITFIFKDANRVITSPAGSSIDLSNEQTAKKISAASGVSKELSNHSISANDLTEIQDKIISIIANTNLTIEQFEEVVKYTNTIFTVVDKTAAGTQLAIAKLKEVLDPSKTQQNITKIIAFNKWVINAKSRKEQNGDHSPVSKEEIEHEAWIEKPMFMQVSPNYKGSSSGTFSSFDSFTGFTFDGNSIFATYHPDGSLYEITRPNTDTPFDKIFDAFPQMKYTSGPAYLSINNHRYIIGISLDSSFLTIFDLDRKEKILVSISGTSHGLRTVGVDALGHVLTLSASGEIFISQETIGEMLSKNSWNTGTSYSMAFSKVIGSLSGVTNSSFFGGDSYVDENGDVHMIAANKNIGGIYDWNINAIQSGKTTTPTITQIPSATSEVMKGVSITVAPINAAGQIYAYLVDEKGNLWRILLNGTSKFSMKKLFNINELKDQNGDSIQLNPEWVTGKIFTRAMNYDPTQKGPLALQISILTSILHTDDRTYSKLMYINLHDNTQEVQEIFNFLIP